MGRLARAFIEILRLTFRRERLEEAAPRKGRARRAGFLRMLFGPEHLSFDPPAVKQPRLGFARMLFAPENLPFDPPATGRRHSRWLRWLFGREPLDRS